MRHVNGDVACFTLAGERPLGLASISRDGESADVVEVNDTSEPRFLPLGCQ
jgi:hypothetical protein